MKKLHVFAQPWWHQESFIVGTPEAIRALREACDRALQGGPSGTSAFTSDGEGFHVIVVPLAEEDSRWDDLMLPYTDKDMYAPQERAASPVDVMGSENYVRLVRAISEESDDE